MQMLVGGFCRFPNCSLGSDSYVGVGFSVGSVSILIFFLKEYRLQWSSSLMEWNLFQYH